MLRGERCWRGVAQHQRSVRCRRCPDGASRAGAGLKSDSERRLLRQARREVHVAGWALALERALVGAVPRIRGPEASVLSPPLRSTPDGRVAIGPADLRLPADGPLTISCASTPRAGPQRSAGSTRSVPMPWSTFPARARVAPRPMMRASPRATGSADLDDRRDG